jgi:hypothetical protein
MGWIISIAALLVGAAKGNVDLLYISGLFAIAGSIGGAAGIIKNGLVETIGKTKEDKSDV